MCTGILWERRVTMDLRLIEINAAILITIILLFFYSVDLLSYRDAVCWLVLG